MKAYQKLTLKKRKEKKEKKIAKIEEKCFHHRKWKLGMYIEGLFVHSNGEVYGSVENVPKI